MKRLLYALFLVMMTLTAACAAPSSGAEPRPPDPFPIELSSRLAVMGVHVEDAKATLHLAMFVRRQADYRDSVKLHMVMWDTTGNKREEKVNKRALDQTIERYVKQEVTDNLTLDHYGTYELQIEASYNGYGQSERYRLVFDEKGVSADRTD